MLPDPDTCYRAVTGRDTRFDGWFFTAVTTTGIYCRPSCPAVTPRRDNVRFYPSAAAAQEAGFRACKRCRPDAVPGSPEWDARGDLVARAMRLIADGVVDREGVAGLAHRLNYSERHLNRALVAEVGAGPQALARAARAETARLLIETTDLRMADVAFAAGFASVRQFNDTVRAVFASAPSELRAKGGRGSKAEGRIGVRLAYRRPFAGDALFDFLGRRAVDGLEAYDGGPATYARSVSLPHGSGVVSLTPGDGYVTASLALRDLRDLAAAVHRCRALLDLDADPVTVDAALSRDPILRRGVERVPGRRVPRALEPAEIAGRAVLGQRVSVAAARTFAARLVARHGEQLPHERDGIRFLWPRPGAIADGDLSGLGLTRGRETALRELCRALDNGKLTLDPGSDRTEVRRELLALPGIGEWTASYIAMRALGDPDAFPATDLGVRKGMAALGGPSDPSAIARRAEQWRPWRAYALQHLWAVA